MGNRGNSPSNGVEGSVRSRAMRGPGSPSSTRRGQPFRHRAPGLRFRCLHNATSRTLVKNHYANLCSFRRHDHGSLQGRVTAGSLRDRISPASNSLAFVPACDHLGMSRWRGEPWRSTAFLSMPVLQPCQFGCGWMPEEPQGRDAASRARSLESIRIGMSLGTNSGARCRQSHNALTCHSNRVYRLFGEPFSLLAHPAFGELGQPENGPCGVCPRIGPWQANFA